MNNLEVNQINIDGQAVPVVTSRQIAVDFEKRHTDVTEIIRKLTTENSAVKNMMIESEFEHRGNKYTEYLLTRDGFSLLVMGFTGSKALAWKLKYIEAFNKMEEELKGQAIKLSTEEMLELQFRYAKEVKAEVEELKEDFKDFKGNSPLFNVECKDLQALVKKRGIEILQGKSSKAYKNNSLRGKVYSDIQSQLKREFGVTRYEAIKRSQLEKAKKIINSYKAPYILEMEISKLNTQMNLEVIK